MTKLYLVTGGAGFIGSNVVAALSDRGDDVVVCDRLGSQDKWRNLTKHQLVDIVAPERLEEWLALRGKLDAVIHMGAISSTMVTDVDQVFEVNVGYSSRLWDWCAEHETPFIYASSAATYGDGKQGFDDDGSSGALARLRPLNAYGWSKNFFDRWVARRVETGSPTPPQWVGLKLFNVYGPNEYHKGAMGSLVVQRYSQASSGLPIKLFASCDSGYEDGGQMRDFIWVGDCVDVILWLLEHREVSGLFNLGSGSARSFAALARALAVAVDVPATLVYEPMPGAIQTTFQYFTEAQMDRLRSVGYTKSFTPLEHGVLQYVEQYLSRPDRYR